MDKIKKSFKLQNSIIEYFSVGEVFMYFFRVFRKNDSAKHNFNLRVMHGINKISIIMFLIALMVLMIRFFTRE
ncbi:MAG: hypothetical protein NZM38_00500 [Cytophagales bacterium]|nr:hypothetical protein [Cytophagales bacterium]MDW8383227.1 DUF6728 family protein [Flammeovirgaceae bacterium]